MRKTRILPVLLLLLSSAVSLIAADQCKMLPARPDVKLEWVDVKSGKVLWTVNDIVTFNWETQTFLLTRERAMDVMMLPMTQHRPIVVRDKDGVIYKGDIAGGFSSEGYDGPVIMFQGLDDIKPPVYRIDGWYGGNKEGKRSKERFAPRLRKALEDAGVLGELPKNIVPVSYSFSWIFQERGLNLGIGIFPETLRSGRAGKMLLTIQPPDKWHPEYDSLSVDVIVVDPDGRVATSKNLIDITVEKLKSLKYDDLYWVFSLDNLMAGAVDDAVIMYHIRMEKKDGSGSRTVKVETLHPMKVKDIVKN